MTTTDGARPPVTVSEVLLRYLGAQVAQIRRQDLPVRLDAPEAVHDMRVAGRRLRSTLVTFEPLIEPSPAQRIRRDLRWLGRLLGAARDAEVRRERLTSAVAAEPPGVVATEEVVREVRE